MTDAASTFVSLLREDFGPLLVDDDVDSIRVLPDGHLVVSRRGRQEYIDARAGELSLAARALVGDGPISAHLFDVPLASGAGTSGVRNSTGSSNVVTYANARVNLARAPDGGALIYIEKRSRLCASVSALEDAGVVASGAGNSLMSHVVGGGSLLACGPSRVGALQLVAAIAQDLATLATTFFLEGTAVDNERQAWRLTSTKSDSPPVARLQPLPLAIGPSHPVAAPFADDLVTRARLAIDVGAVFLLAADLTTTEYSSLLDARLGATLLAQLRDPFTDDTQGSLPPRGRLICEVGFGPRGDPRLTSFVGDLAAGSSQGHSPRLVASQASSRAPSPIAASAIEPTFIAENQTPTTSPTSASSIPLVSILDAGGAELPPLQPLGPAPPKNWGSHEPEMDPGWDLSATGNASNFSGAASNFSGSSFGSVDVQNETTSANEASKPRLQHDDSHDDDTDGLRGFAREGAKDGAQEGVRKDVAAFDADDEAAPPLEGFAATMKSVGERPSFTPRTPQEHPQAKKLREDPFGGLTFEPPPGGPAPDPGREPEPEDGSE